VQKVTETLISTNEPRVVVHTSGLTYMGGLRKEDCSWSRLTAWQMQMSLYRNKLKQTGLEVWFKCKLLSSNHTKKKLIKVILNTFVHLDIRKQILCIS
jgi:hypothetical protein